MGVGLAELAGKKETYVVAEGAAKVAARAG